jgi:hypothetical protein
LGEEVGGEVFRVVVQLQGSGRIGQAEMVRTKAEVRLRASDAATLPVGVAIDAPSGIVDGNASRFREKGGAGIRLEWIHDVPSEGPPAICMNQKKRLTKSAFRKRMILKGMSFAEQNGKRGKKGLVKQKSGSKLPNSKRNYLNYWRGKG